MRYQIERSKRRLEFRIFKSWQEVAYVVFGLCGLQATIEFPTSWHDHSRAWIRFGLGFVKIAFSFRYGKLAPDHGQCCGPTYGFQFFEDLLWIQYGQDTGSVRLRKAITIYMPWHWEFKEHIKISDPSTHKYTYVLKSGEIQEREATIYAETREWRRFWFPWRLFRKTIDVSFNGGVGEGENNSWKGGTWGCGYEMRPGEAPLDTLRRMEKDRKFN